MTDYITFDGVKSTTVSDALFAIMKKYNLPIISGGSGRGWSYWSLLQKCPYAFYLRYVKKAEETGERVHMEIGSAVHAFLARHYDPADTVARLPPELLHAELIKMGCNEMALTEAWRLFSAYHCYYDEDYLTPLAVEYTASDPKTKNTCRYDAIATVKGAVGYPDGTYIVEHKTSSHLSRDVMEGWLLDGEILGELALWNSSEAVKQFGPITGLIVNIIVKTKTPGFHRVFINPNETHMRQHFENLKYMAKLKAQFERKKFWPRYNSSCIHRYGMCQYWGECAAEGAI